MYIFIIHPPPFPPSWRLRPLSAEVKAHREETCGISELCLYHILDRGNMTKVVKGRYEKVSDVVESRAWFASKNLTPRRMH